MTKISHHEYLIKLCTDSGFQKQIADIFKQASALDTLPYESSSAVLKSISERFEKGVPTVDDVKTATDFCMFADEHQFDKKASLAVGAAIAIPTTLGAGLNIVRGVVGTGASSIPGAASKIGDAIAKASEEVDHSALSIETSRARTLQYKIMTQRLKSLIAQAQASK